MRLPPIVLALVMACGGAVSAASGQALPAPRQRACPYDFHAEMPPGAFCVYRGDVRGGNGEVCAKDVVLLWSTYGSPPAAEPREHEIYIGFAGIPDLVMHAAVEPEHADRAEMKEFAFSGDQAPTPLDGELSTPSARPGTRLYLALPHPPREFQRGDGCSFASYEGDFMGLIRGRDALAQR